MQVLITYTWAGVSNGTVRKPPASSSAWTSEVSYWFSLHPSVANATVTGVRP